MCTNSLKMPKCSYLLKKSLSVSGMKNITCSQVYKPENTAQNAII